MLNAIYHAFESAIYHTFDCSSAAHSAELTVHSKENEKEGEQGPENSQKLFWSSSYLQNWRFMIL
jgi:hypothetical protein